MRFFFGLLLTALLAVPAVAQPWYARGDFNGGGLTNPLIDQGGGHWTADVTGLFENESYFWKIAEEDYSPEMPGIGPGHDGRVHSNALGEIHFHLYDQTSWNDGWFPNNVRRVGYDDHQVYDWEIVGSFNGWPGGAFDPNYALTDMGNGLHRGTFTFDTGIYDFKFRGLVPQTPVAPPNGFWNTSIGSTFDSNGANNTFAVTGDDQDWTFELDLPNGRFRYFTEDAPELQGDHNSDGSVDAADYVAWRKTDGGNETGYTQYRQHFGETGGGGPVTWLARNLVAPTPLLPDQTLVDEGGGLFTASYSGLTPQADYEFRVLRSDASAQVPGSNNVKIRADISGNIDLSLYELDGASWGDGWNPDNAHRVGYEDHNEFDWEIMGSFPASNWGTPLVQLTDQGNGLHTGTVTIDTAGSYEFKFRQQGDWTTSIGADFGNNAPNATLTSTAASELWHFELDLPNGRWRAYLDGSGGGGAVPEPGSLLLMVLAGLAISACTRRK